MFAFLGTLPNLVLGPNSEMSMVLKERLVGGCIVWFNESGSFLRLCPVLGHCRVGWRLPGHQRRSSGGTFGLVPGAHLDDHSSGAVTLIVSGVVKASSWGCFPTLKLLALWYNFGPSLLLVCAIANIWKTHTQTKQKAKHNSDTRCENRASAVVFCTFEIRPRSSKLPKVRTCQWFQVPSKPPGHLGWANR